MLFMNSLVHINQAIVLLFNLPYKMFAHLSVRRFILANFSSVSKHTDCKSSILHAV